jgi:hypothetical protein
MVAGMNNDDAVLSLAAFSLQLGGQYRGTARGALCHGTWLQYLAFAFVVHKRYKCIL